MNTEAPESPRHDLVLVSRVDLLRMEQYINDASLGEYGYRDSEGKMLLLLLDKAIRGNRAGR